MLNQISQKVVKSQFNLTLSRHFFSHPHSDRSNAIVVANHPDVTAGIATGDLLCIDFTQNQVEEGLYVITLDDGWIGFRFFEICPELHIKDHSGSYPVTQEIMQSIKVVGKVKDIYRPTTS